MKFTETELKGAFIVDVEPFNDSRGMFGRTYCKSEFAAVGISFEINQVSTSFNTKKFTVRGMHYQIAPYVEQKLVRCTAGELYDVLVDIRPESPTFRKWIHVNLSAENRRMMFIPAGIAHGYQTLTDNTEILYMIDMPFEPSHYRGARWNDPAFGITWPSKENVTISDKDAGYGDFSI